MLDLLYTDETNLSEDPDAFFIYGGVVIPGDKARALHDALETITSALPARLRPLKWTHAGVPKELKDEHIAAKRALFEAAEQHEVRLLFTYILNSVIRGEKRGFQINTVLRNFDEFYLAKHERTGVVLVDTYSKEGGDLKQRDLMIKRFSEGLEFRGRPNRRLKNVLGIHEAHCGASHFCSVVDVVLGAVRYVFNEGREPKNVEKTREILQRVRKLLIFENDLVTPECAAPRPMTAYATPRAKYDELREFLRGLGLRLASQSPGQR